MHKLKSTYQQLYEGCLTGAITHAVWVMGTPALKYLQYWDGFNFHLKDLTGAFCTVSFHPTGLFGAFFDPSGERSPFASDTVYSLERFLDPLPPDIREVAHSETLLYFLQDYDGEEIPLITAVIWNQDQQLFTLDAPEAFRSNGGYLIDHHLLGYEASMARWKTAYHLSDHDVAFVKNLVDQKQKSEDRIEIGREEIESLSTFKSADFESIEELLGYMKIYIK